MAGQAILNVESIFDNLSYGSAPDSESVALSWLNKHSRHFGLYINGQWVHRDTQITVESRNPANDELLATTVEANEDDINLAVSTSREAFNLWSSLNAHLRARYLYSIARTLQKCQSLLAVVEAIDSGKTTRETRGTDIPAVIRHFYHYAGWAQIKDSELAKWKPYGVTVILPHWSFPLLHLASRVAAALATGNTVIILPSSLAPLSALLFADICSQVGLPKGVVNVVTASKDVSLLSHPNVDKVFFAGSIEEGQRVRKLTAGTGKSLSLELSGRCPVLVFEEADIDSAVEGIIEAAFFNNGLSNHSGTRLLIQETVYSQVIEKLKIRMSKLTVGKNFEKNNDQGPLISSEVALKLITLLQSPHGGQVYQVEGVPNQNNYFPPTLIYDVQTSSEVYVDEFYGPLLVAVAFRTVKEGIALANHSIYGIAASVWTENINVALEAASCIQAGTVWINAHNLTDAAAGVGGCKKSGYGRSGGKRSLYDYVQPNYQNRSVPRTINVDFNKFGTSSSADILPIAPPTDTAGDKLSVDKTYKLFYGGGQKRPDSGATYPIRSASNQVLGYVPDGGRKDIRNAVEAADKVARSWAKKEGHGKAQILYYVAENLQSRLKEFADLISAMTNKSKEESTNEVEVAIQRLFYWAAYCDKYGGLVQETSLYGLTVEKNESVGVIGIICPDNFPFLGFISMVAPAIARGNAVVIVPSNKFPLAALGFHQILETSDLPGGVINIITGDQDVLTRTLTEHHDVNAVWYFGSAEGSKFVEFGSASNVKATWVNYGAEVDFINNCDGEELLYHSTTTKSIWMPMGDVFAN
ncbi:aldehyde dehydrogenase family 16 member A1 [Biomphalaria pfeifferi]|uniref:Aldehyde dehydrogenase family 16 member A1 n=1 Tax=Biomphalaria pfeifferi TaxID=112525 RepID=A0AAD8BE07_BIOPF|nr:aldehyde dehydrogenase family 16 member A1 [Biomphalaria pfeifferi]